MSKQPRDAEWPKGNKPGLAKGMIECDYCGDILSKWETPCGSSDALKCMKDKLAALRTPAPATQAEDEARVAEIEKRHECSEALGAYKYFREGSDAAQAFSDRATLLRLLKKLENGS